MSIAMSDGATGFAPPPVPFSATPEQADSAVTVVPDAVAVGLAELFRLLAEESRLRILFLLQQQELHVRTLCRLLGQSQPAVSHHLALLRTAGLIDLRRDGKHNYYRILPQRFESLLAQMFRLSADGPHEIRFEEHVLSYSRRNSRAAGDTQ